jgi:SAM-dependent methyltransferase
MPKPAADLADRHDLYQRAVQDVDAELDFVRSNFIQARGRDASLLREDFCGTANTACHWVTLAPHHRALGVDLDEQVLAWGRSHNVATLDQEQAARVELIHADVAAIRPEPADIVLAMNFSYYLFLYREELLAYFKNVLCGLAPGGLFYLDAYGGYEAPMEIQEPRECDGFTYIWDQASFNPIDSQMECNIHFEFPDGSRMEKAFSYRWRLWTLPEIRETLYEAGFTNVEIYWEGTDEESGEGNGIYSLSEVGDADAGWICYIVAHP